MKSRCETVHLLKSDQKLGMEMVRETWFVGKECETVYSLKSNQKLGMEMVEKRGSLAWM